MKEFKRRSEYEEMAAMQRLVNIQLSQIIEKLSGSIMTAKQIRAYRVKHFGTQAKLAAALGVTRGAVAMWEQGRRPVPGPIIKLLNFLVTTGMIGKEETA